MRCILENNFSLVGIEILHIYKHNSEHQLLIKIKSILSRKYKKVLVPTVLARIMIIKAVTVSTKFNISNDENILVSIFFCLFLLKKTIFNKIVINNDANGKYKLDIFKPPNYSFIVP